MNQGRQPSLFGDDPAADPATALAAAGALPPGLEYRAGFIDAAEEEALLARVARLALREATCRGYIARRRVARFGAAYGEVDGDDAAPVPPIPEWLLPLRARAAAWAGGPEDAFISALVAEYRPGVPLGWHRDMPDHETVAGVSLLGHARMRFRPYPPVRPTKAEVVSIELPPRSAYLMRAAARWGWQHSVAPTPELRYSITFRTPRARR